MEGPRKVKTGLRDVRRQGQEVHRSYAAPRDSDAVVFTAGIGENGWELRELICDNMEALGIRIDKEANKVKGEERIVSTPDSRVAVLVVPTNEELMIARETLRLTS